MYSLDAAPRLNVDTVLREHIARASELLAELRAGFLAFRDMAMLTVVCRRCMANLDALRVGGPAAIEIAQHEMEDDSDVASVVVWLLAEGDSAERAVGMLGHESPEIRRAAWFGLRLADATRVREQLCAMASGPAGDVASAAAFEILAFHREPVQLEPMHDASDEIAWLFAEAAGRLPGAWSAADLERALGRSSRRVKEAALRASARSGLRELVAVCQDAADHATSAEAVEFLGVVGSHDDVARLQHIATSTTARPMAKAGVVALGRLGFAGAIPTLLYLLDEPGLGETAAAAIVRIVGEDLPRSPGLDPPHGAGDDDLDVWEPIAPVDAPRAREWWAARASRFDPKKCYQTGMCVSDDPLGAVFDRLPAAARNDVYLRQRGLVPGTPDWELETWTWRQRQP